MKSRSLPLLQGLAAGLSSGWLVQVWPLFAEHFTEQEQEHLVGQIVGRTGAEVLQAMLPWVTGKAPFLSPTCNDSNTLSTSWGCRQDTKHSMFTGPYHQQQSSMTDPCAGITEIPFLRGRLHQVSYSNKVLGSH